jgi:hypothetical protein
MQEKVKKSCNDRPIKKQYKEAMYACSYSAAVSSGVGAASVTIHRKAYLSETLT